MARDEKRLQLRPVDDEAAEITPVVRLQNRETESREKDAKPVRLGTPMHDDADVSQRLDLPDREEVELRTHQPGIEALIEPEMAAPELVEENWGEATVRRYPIPWGWFALIGLAIAGAVIWSLARMQKADEQAEQIRADTHHVLVDEEQEEREAGQLVDRIEKSLRNFFAARTLEAMSAMVRHPERVTPLMRSHYGDGAISVDRLKSIRMLQPLTLDNRGNFWMAAVILTSGTPRNLIIEIQPNGEPQIDWETMVCYQPMKWDDFVNQRPAGSSLDFRVYAEQDNFYSHEFSDSKNWASYRLTALDSNETLFGYIQADSEEAAKLQQLIHINGGRRITVILRLNIPEGLQSRRGAVIEKVVNSRWLYLDPPDTGS